MTGFFSPNFSILQEWKSTFSVAFSQLRRIAFATEDTFTFSDFDPQLDFDGMIVTNLNIVNSRYCKIGKMFFFCIAISATIAAPFSTQVIAVLPLNLTNLKAAGAGCRITNAGVGETGTWSISSGDNRILFRRAAVGAYTAGTFEVIANGFIEVI